MDYSDTPLIFYFNVSKLFETICQRGECLVIATDCDAYIL
jgi:hypothetical protein